MCTDCSDVIKNQCASVISIFSVISTGLINIFLPRIGLSLGVFPSSFIGKKVNKRVGEILNIFQSINKPLMRIRESIYYVPRFDFKARFFMISSAVFLLLQ